MKPTPNRWALWTLVALVLVVGALGAVFVAARVLPAQAARQPAVGFTTLPKRGPTEATPTSPPAASATVVIVASATPVPPTTEAVPTLAPPAMQAPPSPFPTEPATLTPTTAPPVVCDTATVIDAEVLSIRAQPSLDAPRVGVVQRGGSVAVLCGDLVEADERVWAHVRSAGGVEGWMSTRYLAIGEAAVAPTTVVSAPATFTYVFPVRAASYNYGVYHHDYPATDIFCPVGSDYLATTSGVVEFVSRTDRWDPATDSAPDRGGISVSMVGDDGVRYYGSHLAAIADGIDVGVRVQAGQLLGLTGQSGNARSTPPHVHYGISRPTTPDDWQTRRGQISPYPYLQAWERGEMVTPDLNGP